MQRTRGRFWDGKGNFSLYKSLFLEKTGNIEVIQENKEVLIEINQLQQ